MAKQSVSKQKGKSHQKPVLELSITVREQDQIWPAPIRSSHCAAYYLQDKLKNKDREHFVALHLDTKNQLLAFETISIGSLNASIVHPRECFKAALLNGSAAVIFAHNHPSGDPEPSERDIEITGRLCRVGDLIGIRVHDHIIVGRDCHFSFGDRGMLRANPESEQSQKPITIAQKKRRREMKEEVRRIRRKLELTPRRANALFCGKNENNFYQFENGHAEPGPATMKLLRILDSRPELLQEIVSE